MSMSTTINTVEDLHQELTRIIEEGKGKYKITFYWEDIEEVRVNDQLETVVVD